MGNNKVTISSVDLEWMEYTEHVSKSSLDPSTKCGCCVVSKDGIYFASGYNKFPRNSISYDYLIHIRDSKYDRIGHAELEAILNFGLKHPLYLLTGGTAYIWPLPPCSSCAIPIIKVGINRVVHPKITEEGKSERWKENTLIAREMMQCAGIEIVELDI